MTTLVTTIREKISSTTSLILISSTIDHFHDFSYCIKNFKVDVSDSLTEYFELDAKNRQLL